VKKIYEGDKFAVDLSKIYAVSKDEVTTEYVTRYVVCIHMTDGDYKACYDSKEKAAREYNSLVSVLRKGV
jgi:hypothetical protein